MGNFTPKLPFNVHFFLLEPNTETVKGVQKKIYAKSDIVYYCNFRTFGGTEKVVNDILVLEDTGTLQTWYDPAIKADCQIEIEGKRYEILGTPENVDRRNQFLVIKVRAVKGGA